ncbi:bifunctional hydroxymethylpyrimidine kinase/phosphomethylpyrimidine kinase [Fulvivirga sp. M361]|uniref:bifunctional hydroxymethylpyrimidine kinase/phosphomethylpyrimidine kinase n=1 Tax=Fulvivirga sp. M361 TaxID=2594266 RepID=UPI00117B0E52|nr:bifunctional hydroxymethylpyrimidine kinase/phosphomethylpyrimidine kinase [Fulvivirga sp. M361]TRX60661.1 bifunctional hydroxymethylpyrimidine kinase/phosphomethylpyrimidine kinase [Fulvivirga sp. M361]
MKTHKRILTIAGSDSGGGAGIQADLKTISACGGYGMTAITAITAQNTIGVQAIQALPVSIVKSQIESVMNDIGVDAIKIGMLHSPEIIMAVAEMIEQSGPVKLVLDPVMVATSGDRLLKQEAIQALREHLIPKADLITPNLPEAEVLLDKTIHPGEITSMASELGRISRTSVLLKGGHLPGSNLVDVFYDIKQDMTCSFRRKRINTKNTHGTGCSLSSAITTYYAKGTPLLEAVTNGLDFIEKAIEAGSAYQIGKGSGPVHHFHAWW